jgi:hypothetical protein
MTGGVVKDSLRASNSFWASSSHTNLLAFFNRLQTLEPQHPCRCQR